MWGVVAVQRRMLTELIPKPPDRVWWFLSDLDHDPMWREEVSEAYLVSGVARQEGAVYRESVNWQQFHADVTLSIVEAVGAQRLVVASEGTAYRSRSLWTFEPSGSDTLTSLVFTLEATGAFVLAEGIIVDMISNWLTRDLARLDQYL